MDNTHPWSRDLLFSKAKMYVDEMNNFDPEDWKYALFSSFVLEFLLRASLAHISPALLAQGNEWHNVLYAVARERTNRKIKPKSIATSEVIRRLEKLLENFTIEISGFCLEHLNRRNMELHTGNSIGEITDKTWISQFYRACEVLLDSFDDKLDNLLPEPDVARRMIEGLREEAAKAVDAEIKAHRLIWEKRSDDEKEDARKGAEQWATTNDGRKVQCPSCKSDALLHGEAIAVIGRRLKERTIVTKRRMLATAFECTACGLGISGFSRLLACGLGTEYAAISESPAEHLGLYTSEDMESAREEARREMQFFLGNDMDHEDEPFDDEPFDDEPFDDEPPDDEPPDDEPFDDEPPDDEPFDEPPDDDSVP